MGSKKDKGITLIALVITIIVLLILATISVSTLMGDNGILTKANEAKIKHEHTSVTEAISLAYAEYIMKKSDEQSELVSESLAPFEGFLHYKGFLDTNNIVRTEQLLGSKLSLGNGTETKDVYKMEFNKSDKKWKSILKYCDKNGVASTLWEVEEDIEPSSVEELGENYFSIRRGLL